MVMARAEKIFLPQMTEFRTEVTGDGQVVVDDQADAGAARDGQNGFRHSADFVRRGFLCAELDQIGAAVAELLGHSFRHAAVQPGRVHKRVKPAISERFHGNSLKQGRHFGHSINTVL